MLLPLLAAEDGDAPLHPCHRGVLGDLDDGGPVVARGVGIDIRGEGEPEGRRVAADAEQRRLHRLAVVGDGEPPDAIAIAAQLVVDPGVPVGEQDAAVDPRLLEVADLRHQHQAAAQVDASRDLVADVVLEPLTGRQQRGQLLPGQQLGEVALDERRPAVDLGSGGGGAGHREPRGRAGASGPGDGHRSTPGGWSQGLDSNQRYTVLQTAALATWLPWDRSGRILKVRLRERVKRTSGGPPAPGRPTVTTDREQFGASWLKVLAPSRVYGS